MHSFFSSLPPALPGSHLSIHLCVHALIQHTFFPCVTPVQAQRLTSLPGQDLSPILRDGQAVCSDNHGREVMSTPIRGSRGRAALDWEWKQSSRGQGPSSGRKGELTMWRCGSRVGCVRASQAEGEAEQRRGVRTAQSRLRRGCAGQICLLSV